MENPGTGGRGGPKWNSLHGEGTNIFCNHTTINPGLYVVVQFYPWFNIVIFPLFLGMVMYDNESRRKENKISAKDQMEPEHIHSCQKKAY